MDNFEDEQLFSVRVNGVSPLGNNSIEATAGGHAPVTETVHRGVPLVFDEITQSWIAKLSRVNQEDREVQFEKVSLISSDLAFIGAVGFVDEHREFTDNFPYIPPTYHGYGEDAYGDAPWGY